MIAERKETFVVTPVILGHSPRFQVEFKVRDSHGTLWCEVAPPPNTFFLCYQHAASFGRQVAEFHRLNQCFPDLIDASKPWRIG